MKTINTLSLAVITGLLFASTGCAGDDESKNNNDSDQQKVNSSRNGMS